MRKRVAIVGAGITGLSAAFELTRSAPDLDVVVLEARPRPGGNIVTLEVDDCVFDAGPDSVPTHRPEGLDLCRELGLEDRLTGADGQGANVLLARDGKLMTLPAELIAAPWRLMAHLAFAPLLTFRGKTRALAGLFLPHRAVGNGSLGAQVRARFGHEVADFLVEPLVGSSLAADADTLDPAVARDKWRAVRRTLPRALPARFSRRPTWISPRDGMAELVDALIARIGPHRIETSARVESARRCDEGWELEINGHANVLADHLLIATPARPAARILRVVDKPLAGRVADLGGGSVASVVLAFDDPRPFPRATTLLLPRAERRATLVATWLTTRWEHRAPAGRVVLRAAVGGARAPELLDRATDARLVSLVMADLRAYFDVPRLRWSHVIRFADSMPSPQVGHRSRLEAVRARAARWPGLHLAGGAFGPGFGLASCVAEGKRAAEAILKEPGASLNA